MCNLTVFEENDWHRRIIHLNSAESSSWCQSRWDRQKVECQSDHGSADRLFLLSETQEWSGYAGPIHYWVNRIFQLDKGNLKLPVTLENIVVVLAQHVRKKTEPLSMKTTYNITACYLDMQTRKKREGLNFPKENFVLQVTLVDSVKVCQLKVDQERSWKQINIFNICTCTEHLHHRLHMWVTEISQWQKTEHMNWIMWQLIIFNISL